MLPAFERWQHAYPPWHFAGGLTARQPKRPERSDGDPVRVPVTASRRCEDGHDALDRSWFDLEAVAGFGWQLTDLERGVGRLWFAVACAGGPRVAERAVEGAVACVRDVHGHRGALAEADGGIAGPF